MYVLVAGFDGCSHDMKLLRNNLIIVYPDCLVLCSTANDKNTRSGIEEMGANLASEVETFITGQCFGDSLGRISFIGHSLGGLIIRAALPFLEYYSMKMHLFFTLSSPHLSTVHSDSWQVKAGFWLIKALKKSTSLEQVSMDDAKNPRDTYLYKLSL